MLFRSILIMNTCLIGEFVASLFAIESFIKEKKAPVDIIVSPPQKSMAEKVRGIRNVYIAKSNYGRGFEGDSKENKLNLKKYKEIIVLRSSEEGYNLIKDIDTEKIKTSLKYFILYGLHLFKNLVLRKTPKQWKDLNFKMLNVKERDLNFEDIFKFEKKDFEKIDKLNEIKTKQKIILLHVASNWPMKNWKIKKWIELLKKIKKNYPNYRFVFLGSGEDINIFKKIKLQLNFKIYSLINKIDLKDLLLVMRRSDYFIGIDSGPMNVAHLCNLRSISIMGPGPHMYLPYNKLDIVIDKSNGRGLYQRFFKKKEGGFIDKITVNEAFSAFKKLSNGSE